MGRGPRRPRLVDRTGTPRRAGLSIRRVPRRAECRPNLATTTRQRLLGAPARRLRKSGVPLIQLARSDSRNVTTSATSSGVPRRPNGKSRSMNREKRSGARLRKESQSPPGDRMEPGLTAFTRGYVGATVCLARARRAANHYCPRIATSTQSRLPAVISFPWR
jgi:hypothetical protein